LLWVWRSTAKLPSPPRVCSYLNQNALTGSVPSSLSALTKLESLCVPPSCQRRLHVWLTWVGSVGSGTSLLWVWRSTARAAESASGVQRPQRQ
jgi:hypothetical protein